MPNRRRGEVQASFGGRPHTLRLTLGALAELEDAFAVESLTALAARFGEGRLSSRDLVAILGAALRGGGHAITDAEVADLPLDGGIEGVAEAAAEALRLAFGEAGPNPPGPQARPQRSPGTTSSGS
ncbi:gene transfer agent family protein [Salinarimonas soli]|uniref:Gene transfer agent family protein n=1 Tax=Salinarimonas soli TaxID=1638099 RepID=A0A5B2VE48_9HYPH|nr:gene transfer agent family protein [Salinarimonas soli]KAA2237244.1 gene transfer agent family protein [Salinarimonas soli]